MYAQQEQEEQQCLEGWNEAFGKGVDATVQPSAIGPHPSDLSKKLLLTKHNKKEEKKRFWREINFHVSSLTHSLARSDDVDTSGQCYKTFLGGGVGKSKFLKSTKMEKKSAACVFKKTK